MSTLSQASKLLKRSEKESVINWRAIVSVGFGLVLLWAAINALGTGGLPFGLQAQRVMPDPTVEAPRPGPTQAIIAIPTVDPTATQWPTPIIIEREIMSVVTVEVPGHPVYIDVPGPEVEVTRIVEVTPYVMPTTTPIPLSPGSVMVCVTVEGAKAVYIGGEGVVSSGCKTYAFGVGQTTILVQVDK